MIWFWLLLLILLLTLQFTVLKRGAPYLPTLPRQRQAALDLLDLGPGQILLDLGSGDGGLLIAAAERSINAVGIEVNPVLVLISRLRTRKYGTNVKVIRGNFWSAKWPPADGVFVFLAAGYMQKIDNKARSLNRPLKLVTYAFDIPGRKADAKNGALLLYKY